MMNNTCHVYLRNKISDYSETLGMRGGLMVGALDSGANAPGLAPDRGICVVFLGKTLNSHSASLHPGVYWVLANLLLRVTLRWTSIPFRGD